MNKEYIYGIIIGILYSIFILPNNSKKNPNIDITIYPFLYSGMVIVPINKKKAVHIHHWIIYLLILLLSFFINIPEIIIGFSLFLFIQGICYNDRFEVIRKNPYNNI